MDASIHIKKQTVWRWRPTCQLNPLEAEMIHQDKNDQGGLGSVRNSVLDNKVERN